MNVPDSLAVLQAAFSLQVMDVAKRYAVTSHGDNPWSMEALVNALCIHTYVERALAMVAGQIDSMYRCAAINAKVGGVEDSRHLQALAVDVRPSQPWTIESAFRHLLHAARGGALGPVRAVIWEPDWVHVDWLDRHEPAAAPKGLRKLTDGRYLELTNG